ncbi:MAG: discoidin domain-containing protein [Deltaproteobacteria bacterium]|nr:discoidin domain-containing protein [Deltaproteobacteria bacterium]
MRTKFWVVSIGVLALTGVATAKDNVGTGRGRDISRGRIDTSTQVRMTGVTNLARGKTATQSSTGYGGVASRAVDGNTNGNFAANSTTHTGNDREAWWQVDLGVVATLDRIVIYNRTDCCMQRLSNFNLMTSIDNVQWTLVESITSPIGESMAFRAQRSARYVRIQLLGKGWLSLAEVVVFGEPPAGTGRGPGRMPRPGGGQATPGTGGGGTAFIDVMEVKPYAVGPGVFKPYGLFEDRSRENALRDFARQRKNYPGLGDLYPIGAVDKDGRCVVAPSFSVADLISSDVVAVMKGVGTSSALATRRAPAARSRRVARGAGGAAVMESTAIAVQPLSASVALVFGGVQKPICDELLEKEKKGEIPAGEKPPTSLADESCLTDAERTAADQNDAADAQRDAAEKRPDIAERAAARVKAKAARDNCIPPHERYQMLLPEIVKFVKYTADRAFLHTKPKNKAEAVDILVDGGCRAIARKMPGYAKIVKMTIGKPQIDGVGDWDKEAKDPSKREEFKQAFADEFGKPASPGKKEQKDYEPPKRDEVIEVCTVTHLQLEKMLRADLARVVAPLNESSWGTKAATLPLKPVSDGRSQQEMLEASKVFNQIKMAVYDAVIDKDGKRLYQPAVIDGKAYCAKLGGVPTLHIDTQGFGSNQNFTRLGGCMLSKTAFQPPGGFKPELRPTCHDTAEIDDATKKGSDPKMLAAFKALGWTRMPLYCRVNPHLLCAPYSFSVGKVFKDPQPSLATGRKESEIYCEFPTGELNRRISEYFLSFDLSKLAKGLDHMKGQGFSTVTDRLVGHYRKGGNARVFDAAEKAKGQKTNVDVDNVPGATKEEVTAQNAGAPRRQQREVLRRYVGQWTDAFEYGQMVDFLKERSFAPPPPIATNMFFGDPVGAAIYKAVKNLAKSKDWLFQLYRTIEGRQLGYFFADCNDMWDVCQAPKLNGERNACMACARKAVAEFCVDGKKDGVCSGPDLYGGRVVGPGIGGSAGTGVWLGPRTLANWITARVLGTGLWKDQPACFDQASRIILATDFFGIEQGDFSNRVTNWMRQLPITAWQRCYLITSVSDFGKKPSVCDNAIWGKDGTFGTFKKDASLETKKFWVNSAFFSETGDLPYLRSPIFQVVREHSRYKDALATWATHPSGTCFAKPFDNALQFFSNHWRETESKKEYWGGSRETPDMGDATDGIMGSLAPIIGKILGMLMNAAGITDMMKTLAKAAGLTPEQGADCEDAEYRTVQMKIAKGSRLDNKRGCLSKVFAKNFVSVLESIIVMLGNKLVDWSVQLLKTGLQAAKSALLSAAGSVPFIGGILVTAIDIAWELIFEFAVKALLKGLVVANLPEWLQIKKLAKLPVEELLDNPIVAVVMGIITYIIDAAVTYGNSGFVTAGFATLLSAIKEILESQINKNDPAAYFWVRALIYAKKELLSKGGGGGNEYSFTDQLKNLGAALVAGFGTAVERNLTGTTLTAFKAAVDDLKNKIQSGQFEKDLKELSTNPVGALKKIIGETIVPIVLPVVLSFVKAEDWVKNAIGSFTKALTELLGADKKPLANVVHGVASAVTEGVKELLGGIKYGSDSLRSAVLVVFKGAVDAVFNPNKVGAPSASDLLKGAVKLAGTVISDQARGALGDAEGKLVGSGMAAVFDIIAAGKAPSAGDLLSKVGSLLAEYGEERLKPMAPLAGFLASYFFGPTGPFQNANAFNSPLAGMESFGQRFLAPIRDFLDWRDNLPRAMRQAFKFGDAIDKLTEDQIDKIVEADTPAALAEGISLLAAMLRPKFLELWPVDFRDIVGPGYDEVFGLIVSVVKEGKQGWDKWKGQIVAKVVGAFRALVKRAVRKGISDPAVGDLLAGVVDAFADTLLDTAAMSSPGTAVDKLLKGFATPLGTFLNTKFKLGGFAGKLVNALIAEGVQLLSNPAKRESLGNKSPGVLIKDVLTFLIGAVGDEAGGTMKAILDAAAPMLLQQIPAQ